MAVPSFKTQNSFPAKKVLFYAVAIIGVGLLVYFGGGVLGNIGSLRGKSSITITSQNEISEVYVDDEYLGVTPIESKEINAGETRIRMEGELNNYEVTLDLLANSEATLNRDLGVNETFSSGQNFWFEKSDSNTVLNVISDPTGATIYIDGSEVGKTPFSYDQLTDGEYDLRIEHPGYESDSSRINVSSGNKLNVSVKLFPTPVPTKVDLLDGSETLFDVFSDNPFVTSDPSAWVQAIIYWNTTRGINLSGAGVNKEPVFDYFVDYKGSIYGGDGNVITAVENNQELADAGRGAYLRRLSDGEGVSDAAKTSLESIGSVAIGVKRAKILETGVGWLRVRSEPSLDGEEVTTVNVGEEFPVLEEVTGWVKITVDAETEGWVSADYVEIIGSEETSPSDTADTTDTAEEAVEEPETSDAVDQTTQ